MRRALYLSLLALLIPFATAQAQSPEVRMLLDRIDRLQRDVDTLQRQVYRGQVPSAPVGAPLPPGAANAMPPIGAGPVIVQGEGLSTQAINRFETRISQLESTLRDLTGKIEEISFGSEQTRRQLEKLSGDIDLRFQDLEKGRPPAGQTASAAPATAPASQAGNLGAMTERQLQANAPTPPPAPAGRPAPAQQAARPPAPVASVLPDGSAEDQYKFAFNILLQNDYDQAERAFRAYIDKHPSDSRTDNARYWLAETFYVRDKFEPASTAFAEAYAKAPTGAKAPDNLLKLGMSLAKLNKPTEACAAFKRLGDQFPNAPGTIKSRATAERTRLNCK
jgi:tol-pal system protein YbgF